MKTQQNHHYNKEKCKEFFHHAIDKVTYYELLPHAHPAIPDNPGTPQGYATR